MVEIHNPRNLTPEQVEVSGGWRLLDVDEVKNAKIQFFQEIENFYNNEWDDTGWCGRITAMTYRTKLTRKELAKRRAEG